MYLPCVLFRFICTQFFFIKNVLYAVDSEVIHSKKKYSLILIFEVYIATYTPESNRKMQMNEEKELSNRTIKQNNEEIFARGENF